MKALMNDAKVDLSKSKMLPCVVPDRGVSGETMDAAFAALSRLAERTRPSGNDQPKRTAWWKLW